MVRILSGRVVLNGKNSEWKEINAGVPQGSVFGPLLSLIYINDLPDVITSICKVIADDTSLFSKVLDVNESTKKLNLQLVNGLSNGKCILILIPINRLMESYFLKNQKSILIHLSSIISEVNKKVFFFHKTYFRPKTHKTIASTNNQLNILYKEKKN